MVKKINFGVIGTGGRAHSLASTLIRDKQKRGDLIALCDIDDEALNDAEKMVKSVLGHGTTNYHDYKELLANPNIDAVIIATPDHLHCEMAVAAFKAKKHVFCEKPVGINLNQTIEILKAAKESKKILEIGYVLRYAPFYITMKNMIDSGEIGRVNFVTALEEYFGAFHFYRGWWKSREHNGGIMVQKICHDMDLHYWMFGKPKRIVAFESLMEFKPGNWDNKGAKTCSVCKNHCPFYVAPHSGKTKTDECVYNDPHDITDNCQILVQFESGMNLSMGMNFFDSLGQSDRFWRVVGSKAELTGKLGTGILRFDGRFAQEPEMINCNEIDVGGHGGGDEFQMLEFVQGIIEGHEAKAGIESAYWSSIMIMGAQISADTGKIVMVDDLVKKYPMP
jgi:predicted dehydrogenase